VEETILIKIQNNSVYSDLIDNLRFPLVSFEKHWSSQKALIYSDWLTEHFDTLDRTQRVEVPVKRTVEAHSALSSPGASRQHAEQHAEGEHKGAHDYADRPQDTGIAGKSDPCGVWVLVLVLAGATVRSSCNRSTNRKLIAEINEIKHFSFSYR